MKEGDILEIADKLFEESFKLLKLSLINI